MGVRTRVGRKLDSTLGKERTDQIRGIERRTRQYLAEKIAPRRPAAVGTAAAPDPSRPAPAKPQPAPDRVRPALGEPNDRQAGGWIPSDPFVPHPQPTMTRHDLLRGLHEVLNPRTYLEIGVNEGSSLTLSRTLSIGVDPDFVVRRPLHCDLELIRAKSDEFFERPDGLAHFGGVPVDLAFIDGMHLSEFALRDFINVERHLAAGGVTVFDDILPRNALEAARVRRTGAWAGDVYKAVEAIARRRPDLAVISDQHLAHRDGDRGRCRRIVAAPPRGLRLRTPLPGGPGPAGSTTGVHVPDGRSRPCRSPGVRCVATLGRSPGIRRYEFDRRSQGRVARDPQAHVSPVAAVPAMRLLESTRHRPANGGRCFGGPTLGPRDR